MTVRELIQQLSKIENQDLEVKYGDVDGDDFKPFLWNINYPHYEVQDGTTVVNIGVPTDDAITIVN
jgi:hypothetical protein